jgi:spore coat protein CotH
LYIHIDRQDVSTLSAFRDSAIALGVLRRSPNDYVNTNVIYRNQSTKGKVRLKGDWTDHLQEKKWSFRIKLQQPMTDGLKTFSVQHPGSRAYLLGYQFHKLLKQEGILTPEYRFVELIMNGVSWGVYVLEEHLTSRIISDQSDADGVLLKFEDHEFFKTPTKDSTPTIHKAEIKVYGKSKKKKEHKSKVLLAKTIIENYKYQRDTLYNSFDAKKMGTYYALCDLAAAYHSMGWTNIRFYFNFNTQKMEPVGYDGYPIMEWGKPYIGYKAKNTNLDTFDIKMMVCGALRYKPIEKEYLKALKRVTDSEYVKKFMKQEPEHLDFIELEIQKNYPDYSFEKSFLHDNAKAIRASLAGEQMCN